MAFWAIIGGVCVVVAGWLALALLRGRPGAEPAAAYDLRVYRDQLKEVDRDLARGTIDAAEAERVRTEVSRRILTADAQIQAETQGAAQSHPGTRFALAIVAVVVIGGSLWMYTWMGAPGYGDLPQALRIAEAEAARMNRPAQAEAEAETPPVTVPAASAEYEELLKRLRETVAAPPDDLRGQQLLAQNEAARGNFAAAHAAQARVVELRGADATAGDWADYADLLILAAGGYVSPEAEAALIRALEMDPKDGPARYYWGLMQGQTGRPDLAFATWDTLLRESRPVAPWVRPIRAQIEQMAARAGVRYTLPPLVTLPGPTAEQMAAAQEMSDEDQMAMIQDMVERLSNRLATDGGPPEQWARLIGALTVLGEDERARIILREAEEAFGGNAAALAMIDQAARQSGLRP